MTDPPSREQVDALVSELDVIDLTLRGCLKRLESAVGIYKKKVERAVEGGVRELVKKEGPLVVTRGRDIVPMGAAEQAGSLQDILDGALDGPNCDWELAFAAKREALAVVDRARASLKLALDPMARTVATDSAVLATLRARAAGSHLGTCRELLALRKDILMAAADARRGTSGLKWSFASEEQRSALLGAVSFLRTALDGEYGRRARRVAVATEAIETVGAAAAWRDFGRDPGAYLAELERVAPGRFVLPGDPGLAPPRPFDDWQAMRAIEWHGTATKELGEALGEADERSLKERVRDAAYRMVKEDVARQLRAIPVEDLNRSGKGYRVAALRRAGYDNLAAISAATVHNLASVKGLSLSAARAVKGDCEALASELEPSVRLRLSADERTPEATELILGIYALLASRSPRERCESRAELLGGRLAQSKRTLQTGGYGELAWLVWDDLRDAKREAYQSLSEAMAEYPAWHSDDVVPLRNALVRDPARAWQAFMADPVAFRNALEDVVPELVGATGAYGLPDDLAREIEDQAFFPDGLLCTLARYQEWGVKYALHQKRALLGDEMGLGKTVQAIAAMVSLRNVGESHFLVICPASVLANWCHEVVGKSKLRVTRVHGASADSAFDSWRRSGGVAVTTYGMAPRVARRLSVDVGMLVVDEAHYVKNPEARRSRAVREICDRAGHVLFMTGTALENNVGEMIELMGVLQPEVAREAAEKATLASAPAFRELVAPVYFRRRRDMVLAELPELTVADEWSELGRAERAAYERAVLSRNFMAMRRVSWDVGNVECSSKARRLAEIADEVAGNQRKAIVFSYFRDTLDKVCRLLGDRACGPINGSVPPQRRQEIIDEFGRAEPGSVLVAQIQSGGTGLNIQAASVVIICEPQIKPSIESQAISRAYRMGQARNVLVYRLLSERTVDERVTEILAEKQRQFDAFADESVAGLDSVVLDDKTQTDIIEQEIERIKRMRGMASGEGGA